MLDTSRYKKYTWCMALALTLAAYYFPPAWGDGSDMYPEPKGLAMSENEKAYEEWIENRKIEVPMPTYSELVTNAEPLPPWDNLIFPDVQT